MISEIKINPETQKFIQEHIENDVHELALKGSKNDHVDFPFAIEQISSRQKAKGKLPEWVANFDLIFPKSLSIEQSSSEITAHYKSSLLSGLILVDLTAGFGIDGIYLSKKFKKTYLIEKQSELCQILNFNIKKLDLSNIEIINQDAIQFLDTFLTEDPGEVTFYLDPARRGKGGQKVVELDDCEPNILEIKEILFQKGDRIILKLSPMLDLKKLQIAIPEITELQIIAVQNECKEILAVCLKDVKNVNPSIYTMNITSQKEEPFSFYWNEEQNQISEIADSISGYLYEPNSAIMKSGGFKTIGNRFQLKKIDYHSHLYISDTLKEDFPGRVFQIIDHFGLNKAELKEKIKKGEKYNLTTRNFPMETEDLKKKLQIKDGGDQFLFATIWNQKHLLILCRKCKDEHHGRTT